MPPLPEGASDLVLIVFMLSFVAWEAIKRRDQRTTVREVGEVKDQVKNTHSTNLRDDIDEIKTSMNDMHRTLTNVDARTARIGDEVRTQKTELDTLRRDTYAAIAKAERSIAKYHPEP